MPSTLWPSVPQPRKVWGRTHCSHRAPCKARTLNNLDMAAWYMVSNIINPFAFSKFLLLPFTSCGIFCHTLAVDLWLITCSTPSKVPHGGPVDACHLSTHHKIPLNPLTGTWAESSGLCRETPGDPACFWVSCDWIMLSEILMSRIFPCSVVIS